MILSGPVTEGVVHESPDGELPLTLGRYSFESGGLKMRLGIDCLADFEDSSLVVGERLFCLSVGFYGVPGDFCLVIKQHRYDRGLPVYRRVGHVFLEPKKLGKYWFPPKLEHTAVKII